MQKVQKYVFFREFIDMLERNWIHNSVGGKIEIVIELIGINSERNVEMTQTNGQLNCLQ